MRYWFYRVAAAIGPHIPARFGYWLFERFGDLAFIFANRKSEYFENLRHVLGKDATEVRVNAVARAGFRNQLKNYFDLFRSHGLTREKIRTQLAGLHGFEHIENALKRGKGILLGSAHFGAWDLIIHMTTAYLDTRVVLPVERLTPEKFFALVMQLRGKTGIDIVPLEHAPRVMIKTLRAGAIVGLAYDRDITHTGPIVDFLGTPAQMPDRKSVV